MKEIVNSHLSRVRGDKVLWSVVLLLSLFSLLAVYSATGSLAFRSERPAAYFMIKQLGVLALGFFIMYRVHRINYTRFAVWAQVLFYLSLPLLVYTLFAGVSLNEGSRWIRVPVINLTFQTSDLAKLALFMYLARLLATRQDSIQDLKAGFIPVLLPVLAVCALIAPANLSTALMLGMTCCILFFIGRVRVKHIMLLAGAGMLMMTTLFLVSKATGWGRAATWEKRIENFLGKDDPTAESSKDDDFQTEQANIAIANGGITGRGPGNSQQRNFLPHPYSDFIYSIIIEEYGLIGGSVIVLLYLVFLWRSIVLFRRCPYAFGAFLSVGLSITLVFQAMLNMAVNVHLVPVTGLTLPLVSMGGSSIWFTSIAIGIILSVSRYVDEMEGERKNVLVPAAAIVEAVEGGEEESAPAAMPQPAEIPKRKPSAVPA